MSSSLNSSRNPSETSTTRPVINFQSNNVNRLTNWFSFTSPEHRQKCIRQSFDHFTTVSAVIVKLVAIAGITFTSLNMFNGSDKRVFETSFAIVISHCLIFLFMKFVYRKFLLHLI